MQNIKAIAKTVVIFVVSPLIVHFSVNFNMPGQGVKDKKAFDTAAQEYDQSEEVLSLM